jgi:hypothetical protein
VGTWAAQRVSWIGFDLESEDTETKVYPRPKPEETKP